MKNEKNQQQQQQKPKTLPTNWLPVDFWRGFSLSNLPKIRKTRENLFRKQFLSLRYVHLRISLKLLVKPLLHSVFSHRSLESQNCK